MKHDKNIELMETRGHTKRKLTASEKRFVREMQVITKLSLSDLLMVEKNRMPIGV